MLADTARNEFFAGAVARAIAAGATTVLDVGSGTGLLAMAAARAGAARVDAGSGEAVADFYMHLWKCFFACYALLPFVR